MAEIPMVFRVMMAGLGTGAGVASIGGDALANLSDEFQRSDVGQAFTSSPPITLATAGAGSALAVHGVQPEIAARTVPTHLLLGASYAAMAAGVLGFGTAVVLEATAAGRSHDGTTDAWASGTKIARTVPDAVSDLHGLDLVHLDVTTGKGHVDLLMRPDDSTDTALTSTSWSGATREAQKLVQQDDQHRAEIVVRLTDGTLHAVRAESGGTKEVDAIDGPAYAKVDGVVEGTRPGVRTTDPSVVGVVGLNRAVHLDGTYSAQGADQ